jgi:hypothetical protein
MGKLMDHEGKPAKYKVAPLKIKTAAQAAKEKEAAKAKKSVKK